MAEEIKTFKFGEDIVEANIDTNKVISSGGVPVSESVVPETDIVAPPPPQDLTTIDSTDLIDTPESQAAIDAAKAQKDVGLEAAQERQRLGTANETDLKNIEFAIGQGLIERPADVAARDAEIEKQRVADELTREQSSIGTTATGAVVEEPKTTIDKIRAAREDVGTREDVQARLKTDADVAGARATAAEAAQSVNKLNVEIQRFIATSEDEITDIEKVPALLSRLRAAQTNLSEEKNRELRNIKLDLLLAQQNSLIASGSLTEAEAFVKTTAEDIFLDLNDEIDLLLAEGKVQEAEAAELKEASEFDRGMALEGFTKVTGPSGLAVVTEDEIIRIPNPLTGIDDIFRKPQTIAERDTQVIRGAGGNSILVDVNTGEVIKDFGSATKFSAGGAGGTATEKAFITFSQDDKGRFLEVGLDSENVTNIQNRLNEGESIDEIFADSELGKDQESKIRNVLKGVTATQEGKKEEGPTALTTSKANDSLVNNAKTGKGTFGTLVGVEDTSLEGLAQVAIDAGADITGLQAALRATGNYNIETENGIIKVVDNRGINETIGYINPTKQLVSNNLEDVK